MKSITVIGGGVAGVETSSVLSLLGYDVILIEKSDLIGGKILRWDHLFPDFRPASEVQKYLEEECRQHNFIIQKNISVQEVTRTNGKWIIRTSGEKVIESDAIVLATGYEFFDATRKEEYGYNIYDNVITSVDLEDRLKSGKKITTRDGKTPEKIAFIHCVGSRDEKSGNHYCSKVCCITGVKQAIELQKLIPDADIYSFYMDLRMYGQLFEELYRDAQEHHNIQFIRGRLSEVAEKIDKSLIIKAEDTLSGRPLKMNIDLLILLIGMVPGKGTHEIGSMCGLKFNPDGFLMKRDAHTNRNLSSEDGVFLAGSCICPMSINETLENARSAAWEVHDYLITHE